MAKINFLTLANKIKQIAEDKKGENVEIIDVKDVTAITNYFVIVTSNSTPQTNAIANEIEKTMKYDYGVPVLRRESASSSWSVLDFGGILVHIMSFEARQQYSLETIWQDQKTKKVTKVKRITKTIKVRKVIKPKSTRKAKTN